MVKCSPLTSPDIWQRRMNMDEEKKKKYDEFKSFVTYVDILTYALALTEEEHFDANPDKWHEAVYDIWKNYRKQIPELRRIYFTRRPPLPPQSEQVDRLIKIMTMSREIAQPNPRYPIIDMEEAKRENIKKREGRRLAKYSREINAISQILKDKVSVEV